MIHHPNLHHQAMSGHPQHLAGHQPMPGHHQMPPHQMHRENRHVPMHRMAIGPSQASGSMGAHGQSLGGLGGALGVGVPPHHAQRAPHPIRAMPHHAPAQHHTMPQAIKQMRRPYPVGGAYQTGGPGVMPPPYAQAHHGPPPSMGSAPASAPQHPAPPPPAPVPAPTHAPNGILSPSAAMSATVAPAVPEPVAPSSEGVGGGGGGDAGGEEARAAGGAGLGDAEAARPAPSALANSKEKTPMCLVNELARYNKIKHQYRLTSETGPAHKKVFTVTLRLGDTEEYTAEGSSIKRAQHAAASAALLQTQYGAPPPRAQPPHHHTNAHHRHSGAVMPTVELNALAMKLCQPAVYTSVPPVPAPARFARTRAPPPHAPPAPHYRPPHAPFVPHLHPAQRMLGPGLVYRVRVAVGGRAWLGEGPTPQAARHDAAARALHDLRTAHDVSATIEEETVDGSTEALNSEVKSPVSLVHELALKQSMCVVFAVKSERGPPHMRVFITACCVGDMETEGEGNGKKVSKRRAAERMLDEMRRRWPPALLRARPPPAAKRKPQPTKKKSRNLIKENGEGGAGGGGGDGLGGGGTEASDNPISRLAMARHATRARSPQYRVVEERGAARRREFVVQCDAPPHRATGLGPNKKTAKRRAAHNVLLAMELGVPMVEGTAAAPVAADPLAADAATPPDKRKDGEAAVGGGAGGGEARQPVPGVLLMDYHQRAQPPPNTNGVNEGNGTAGAAGAGGGGSSPGAKDQLMYLSQLLGFTVQFSDFPKRNHGEYLSLVSLSTEPPVMCHGGGASTAHSHEQCSRAALRALALMGLDAPTDRMQPVAGAGAKPGALSNGIAE